MNAAQSDDTRRHATALRENLQVLRDFLSVYRLPGIEEFLDYPNGIGGGGPTAAKSHVGYHFANFTLDHAIERGRPQVNFSAERIVAALKSKLIRDRVYPPRV